MIAVDTNILVYSHRADSSFYSQAVSAVKTLAESGADWAIPWPCLHEFIAVVTHPRIYSPPTPSRDALIQIEHWLECPTLYLLSENTAAYWNTLKSLLEKSLAAGGQVHDARIAALCISHGVEKLWTADRDFSRFPELETVNPLRE